MLTLKKIGAVPNYCKDFCSEIGGSYGEESRKK